MRDPSMESATSQPVEILVVDDSPEDIRLIRDAFDRWTRNCHIQVLMKGGQVIEGLAGDESNTRIAKPELILLDWNLPGTSGRDVLEVLKKHPNLRNVPVVVFTSSSAPGDQRSALEMGAACFFTKPLDLDDFFDIVAGLERFVDALPEGER
jgi:two-component system, chemotaxis family, response regulator Rcp1